MGIHKYRVRMGVEMGFCEGGSIKSKAVLRECLLHFVRELSLYSRTLIILTSIIWTCFPGPVFFHEH